MFVLPGPIITQPSWRFPCPQTVMLHRIDTSIQRKPLIGQLLFNLFLLSPGLALWIAMRMLWPVIWFGTARRFRARPEPRPCRSYVAPQILQYLALRKHRRSDLDKASRARSMLSVRIVFALWRRDRQADARLHASALASLDRHIAIQCRDFQSIAACIRQQIKACKTAYLEELGTVFAHRSTAKDVRALYEALRSLVPGIAKKGKLSGGVAVLGGGGGRSPY